MSARQPPDSASLQFITPVTQNLFVQIDFFVAADEALAQESRDGLHGRGGTESSLDFGFHQHALQPPPKTENPWLRLALVSLQQLGADINAAPAGPEFYRGVEWLDEDDSPFFDFGRVCGELEVHPRIVREQISEIFPQYLRAGGRLSFIHSLVDQLPLPELIAAQVATRQSAPRAR